MMMTLLHALLRAEGNDKYYDHINMRDGNSNPTVNQLLMCLIPPSVVAPTLQKALDAGLQCDEDVLKTEAGIFIS